MSAPARDTAPAYTPERLEQLCLGNFLFADAFAREAVADLLPVQDTKYLLALVRLVVHTRSAFRKYMDTYDTDAG